MPSPCEQQPNIENIHKTLERMEENHTLDRKERRDSEKRLMLILEKLTDQGARINHLEEHAENNAIDNKVLFERVRDLELNYAHADGPAVRQHLNDSITNVTNEITEVNNNLTVFGKKVDKLNRFYSFTTHRYALVAYGVVAAMIVIGTVLDLMYHKDTLLMFYHFFKG